MKVREIVLGIVPLPVWFMIQRLAQKMTG